MPLALRPLLPALCLAALLCSLAAPGDADAAQDCCLHLPPRPRPFQLKIQNRLTSYRLQGPQMGCLRQAIVFITRKGRELCISPDADWAPALMEKIDARKSKAGANRLGV